jgi:hypothetical protein
MKIPDAIKTFGNSSAYKAQKLVVQSKYSRLRARYVIGFGTAMIIVIIVGFAILILRKR